MTEIRVLYFAGVRDAVGVADEQLTLPEGVDTVGTLSIHLQEVKPQLRGRLEPVRFAVNEEFADEHAPVRNGDVIALIPPVSGG